MSASRKKWMIPYLLGFSFVGLSFYMSWNVSRLTQVYSITEPQGEQGNSLGCDGSAARQLRKRTVQASTTSMQMWQDQNFSYVRSANYIHSYPQGNVSGPLTISIAQQDPLPQRQVWNPVSLDTGHRIGCLDDDNAGGQQFIIRVVYFVNTKLNPNYIEWFHHQVALFARHSAIQDIYVVADATLCSNETSLQDAFRWLEGIRGNHTSVHLDCHDDADETYEYHGIHKLWEIGQEHPGDRDVAIYMHSKGVTHASTWKEYAEKSHEAVFTERIFSQSKMDQMLEAFQLFPSVVIGGLDCSFGAFSVGCLPCMLASLWACVDETFATAPLNTSVVGISSTTVLSLFGLVSSFPCNRRVCLVQLVLCSRQLFEDC
jgi:hypothetical protein